MNNRSTSPLHFAIAGILASSWQGTALADSSSVAAPASSHSEALEAVVITARRREENSQSVPVSVTALSQKELDEKNIQTMNDLQYAVPSLTVGGVGAGFRDNPQVNLRGQGVSAAGQNGVVQYFYVLTPNPFSGSFGYSTSIYGEPRMFGIRLKYAFGGEARH